MLVLMANLEYRIGELKIDTEKLKFTGEDAQETLHKFVVQAADKTASIYVAPAGGHVHVAQHFELDETNIVGGGVLYMDRNERFVLGGYSGKYKAIPRKAAEIFAELILPRLEEQGIKPYGVRIATAEHELHEYWKKLDF